VAHVGEIRNAYSVLVGKHQTEGPLGRPRSRWNDNIRTAIRKTRWEGVDWIHMAQDRDK
jgi:hypothetical protein